MKKISNLLSIGVVICILSIIIGFVLYANFIPIQDIELLSREELEETHREFAINYPVGKTMFYGGLCGFVICTVSLIMMGIVNKAKRIIRYKNKRKR